MSRLRIRVWSDLHLEMHRNRVVLESFPLEVDTDLIILAGDIANGAHGVRWVTERYPDMPVAFVLGNHEFMAMTSVLFKTHAATQLGGRSCAYWSASTGTYALASGYSERPFGRISRFGVPRRSLRRKSMHSKGCRTLGSLASRIGNSDPPIHASSIRTRGRGSSMSWRGLSQTQ